ncbi:MAG: prolyl oligopeptidase family serine peptidase [Nitrospinota bacterium]|jgi:2,6-dihydroxypseudooxynicotine hydrolase|nr:prolyl oligopeptidase family serine peptidase [Nitrospinota bacterium]MDP7386241.1 prolyl oligopeptidase family serine peptidase [Nitrospinota bacterium]
MVEYVVSDKYDASKLWDYYTARFLSDGVNHNDLIEMRSKTRTWDDWLDVWCELADRHEARGEEALKRGSEVTAGEELCLAGLYVHYGQFLFWCDPEKKNAAQRRKVDLYRRAAPLLLPPAEWVEIPYEGTVLPGCLRMPVGRPKAPCVVLIGGLESTKEESYLFENLCLRRGVATFAYDGPGQGDVHIDLPMQPGFERTATAVLDHLLTRPEIDGERVGVLGRSLGGYYAPLCAAHEPRFRACVSYGAFYDFGNWEAMPAVIKDGFQFVTKTGSWDEAADYLKSFTLAGVLKNLKCPYYILHGERDAIMPADRAGQVADETGGGGGETELVLIKDGIHGVHHVAHIERPKMADWLAAKLS